MVLNGIADTCDEIIETLGQVSDSLNAPSKWKLRLHRHRSGPIQLDE
jgi:hypothetical protein